MTTNRKHRDYLEDIAEEIRKVSRFINNMNFEDFKTDEKTVYAVIRAIEIIGETAKKYRMKLSVIRQSYHGVRYPECGINWYMITLVSI